MKKKVKFIKGNANFNEGDEKSLPIVLADALIKKGWAEEVKAKRGRKKAEKEAE